MATDAAAFRPVHRVAPHPVSSGISIRDLPAATLAQVIKTCQHYEEKGAGQYSTPGYRLLYDLSRDVQDLVRVLKVREDTHLLRERELDAAAKAWSDVFAKPSPSLAAAGVRAAGGANSPAAVAQLLTDLHAENARLKALLSGGDTRADREVSDLRGALRDAMRVAREQNAHELLLVRKEADAVVQAERADKQAAVAAAQRKAADEVAAAQRAAEAAIAATTARLNDQMEQQRAAAASSLAEALAERDAARHEADLLQETLRREAAAAGDAAVRARDAIHGLQRQVAALEERLEAERCSCAEEVLRLRRDHDARMVEVTQRYERSQAATRIAALEAQIAFLTERVRELQALVETLQKAVGRAAAEEAAAAGGVTVGGVTIARDGDWGTAPAATHSSGIGAARRSGFSGTGTGDRDPCDFAYTPRQHAPATATSTIAASSSSGGRPSTAARRPSSVASRCHPSTASGRPSTVDVARVVHAGGPTAALVMNMLGAAAGAAVVPTDTRYYVTRAR